MAKKPEKAFVATPFEIAVSGFLVNHDRKGQYHHLRKLIELVWGDSDITWNPWLEDQLESLTGEEYVATVGQTKIRNVSWTGPGAAGKTFSSGLFAMAWFLCSPHNSSVTLTSTSKQAMAGRVWAVISNLFLSAVHPDTGEPFDWHIINSKKELQWPKGDGKHNIACFAVEDGELLKSVDRIKGRHTERMLLIIDEANGTPEAIFNVIPNMLKGCKELVVLVFDNAGNMYGNHGRCCEPKSGWSSITVDDSEWETKGVPEWNLPPGICRHYDGAKSPNVLAGKTVYPHIYSFENWQNAAKFGEDNIHYWSQDRGFWPPEGSSHTVLSAPLIARCDAAGFNEIISGRLTAAFLDPGFGGDSCVLQLADIGASSSGMMVCQLRAPINIRPKVMTEEERDYQIARSVIAHCKSNNVEPRWYGGDATGVGRGVHAIIAGEWSPDINRVEWNGKASGKPSSQADGRPAFEVYSDQVTELWFAVREFVESGQLKGLYPEAIKQFCSRAYTQQGRMYKLVKKDECKAKLGYSPDEGDAIAGLCEVMRRNGISAEGKIASLGAAFLAEAQRELSEEPFAPQDVKSIPDVGGWAEHDGPMIDWQDETY